MRPYRAFVVNKDGHFKKAVVLNCADDAVAVQEAKKLVDGKYVELWEMERRVAILKLTSWVATSFASRRRRLRFAPNAGVKCDCSA